MQQEKVIHPSEKAIQVNKNVTIASSYKEEPEMTHDSPVTTTSLYNGVSAII